MDLVSIMFSYNVLPRHRQGSADYNSRFSVGAQGGLRIRANPYLKSLPSSPILEDMNTIWDQSKFNTPRSPLIVSAGLQDKAAFSKAGVVSVSDMPIRFPGTEYRLPAELAQFEEAVRACADFAHAANSEIDDYYAYLTIDQKKVAKGRTQRGTEPHSDSIQGPRISPKTRVEHTFLCVDRDPPMVYEQGFDLNGYDADRYFLNPIFAEQADPEKAVCPEPYSMILMDAYTVHQAVPSTQSSDRTLFRLVYSTREFDRLGNTHNDMFDYDWDMVPRPFPQSLELL